MSGIGPDLTGVGEHHPAAARSYGNLASNLDAQGRLVSCLEGGYHLGALAESVQAHLENLLASP